MTNDAWEQRRKNPKRSLPAALLFFALTATLAHAQLPDAPTKSLDRKFVAASAFALAANAADGYTTEHFIGRGGCQHEGWAPALYGRTAPAARVGGVLAAETAAEIALAYWLKKHRHPLWLAPFAGSVPHLVGAIHNAETCNTR